MLAVFVVVSLTVEVLSAGLPVGLPLGGRLYLREDAVDTGSARRDVEAPGEIVALEDAGEQRFRW